MLKTKIRIFYYKGDTGKYKQPFYWVVSISCDHIEKVMSKIKYYGDKYYIVYE